jgi:hypothetical protein
VPYGSPASATSVLAHSHDAAGGVSRDVVVEEGDALGALGGVGAGDDLVIEDDDRADRQFALLQPDARDAQGLAHEVFGGGGRRRHEGPSA